MEASRSLLGCAPAQQAIRVEYCPGVDTLSGVGELVGVDSVAVVNYRGDSLHATAVDHWVCVVASDPARDQLHVACSIRWSDVYRFTDGEYGEVEHPGGRRSNDVLQAPAARIVPGSVLRLLRSRGTGT